MCLRSVRHTGLGAGLTGALLVLFATWPIQAQDMMAFGRSREGCRPPRVPSPFQACPAPEAPPPTLPDVSKPPIPEPPPVPTEPTLSAERSAAAGGEMVALATPNVMGDQLAPPVTRAIIGPRTIIVNGVPVVVFVRQFNTVTGLETISKIPAATHSFKIAENESPRPQNRAFFTFNYFDDVYGSTNARLGADVGQVNVYRETFGIERTFLDGDASFGFRLPLNTLQARDGLTPGSGGTSTDIGDVTLITKFAWINDRRSGNVLSSGLAVTVPTGPDSIGGFPTVFPVPHTTLLQPYLGFIRHMGDFYFQGFSSLNVPLDADDVLLMFNDFQLGYYLYRDRDRSSFLTSVVPMIELHVNTPLTHRGTFNGLVGTPDMFNLTSGLNFGMGQRSQLTVGLVTPMSGPRPFDLEAMAHLNFRF